MSFHDPTVLEGRTVERVIFPVEGEYGYHDDGSIDLILDDGRKVRITGSSYEDVSLSYEAFTLEERNAEIRERVGYREERRVEDLANAVYRRQFDEVDAVAREVLTKAEYEQWRLELNPSYILNKALKEAWIDPMRESLNRQLWSDSVLLGDAS